jgi:L-amino acid N-acyltransferase YncA
MQEFRIEVMSAEDWPAVEQIYKQGIATQNATFETESPGWESWNAKHHSHSRLVARNHQNIVGWAALSPVSTRRVYAGVAEVSIYVAETARGKGLGKALLGALIEQSEQNGIWTLQAGIFPENVASIALHKSLGFRQVGRREKIGQLHGVWRDVILLERRSSTGGDARRSIDQVCK